MEPIKYRRWDRLHMANLHPAQIATYKLLTGKAKKKFKYLMFKGVDFKIAIKLCRNKEKKNIFARENTLTENIVVQIKDKNPLNKEQLTILKKAILAEVDKIPEGGPNPKFLTCRFKNGYLSILCADKESLVWLVDTLKTLDPWPGAKLYCEDALEWYLAHVWIPGCEKQPPDVILQRFQRQNAGLNCSHWRILNVKEEENGQNLFFAIDRESNEALEEIDFKAFLNYTKVTFKIRRRYGGLRPTAYSEKRWCQDELNMLECSQLENEVTESISDTQSFDDIVEDEDVLPQRSTNSETIENWTTNFNNDKNQQPIKLENNQGYKSGGTWRQTNFNDDKKQQPIELENSQGYKSGGTWRQTTFNTDQKQPPTKLETNLGHKSGDTWRLMTFDSDKSERQINFIDDKGWPSSTSVKSEDKWKSSTSNTNKRQSRFDIDERMFTKDNQWGPSTSKSEVTLKSTSLDKNKRRRLDLPTTSKSPLRFEEPRKMHVNTNTFRNKESRFGGDIVPEHFEPKRRDNWTRLAPSKNDTTLENMKSHELSMVAPGYRSYRVDLINSRRSNKKVLLGISGEKIEIEPLMASLPPNKTRMPPVTYNIDSIIECEVISEKNDSVLFRIHYSKSSSYRFSNRDSTAGYLGLNSNLNFVDFECERLMAEVIVNKINMILNMKNIKRNANNEKRIIPFY